MTFGGNIVNFDDFICFEIHLNLMKLSFKSIFHDFAKINLLPTLTPTASTPSAQLHAQLVTVFVPNCHEQDRFCDCPGSEC